MILLRLLQGLYSPWNGSRLAPTFALSYGYRLYYGPDSGPILNTIYGPIAWLAYAPALLGRGSTSVLLIAEAMALGWYFGPAAILALTLSRGNGQRDWVSFFVTLYAFTLISLFTPALSISSIWIHADGPALGLLLLAILCLEKFLASQRGRWGVASAVLLSCSVLTKQSVLPVAVALPLGVAFVAGRSVFVNYSFIVIASAILTLLAASGVFGVWDMLFNMVYIPGEHGFERDFVEAATGFFAHGWLIVLAWIGTLVSGALRGEFSPGSYKNGEEGLGHLRLQLFLRLAALACMPGALLGYAKAGGSFNNFSLSLYFMALSVAWGLSEIVGSASERFRLAAPGGLFTGGSLVMAGFVLLLAWEGPTRARELTEAFKAAGQNPHAEAERFMKAHVGEIYFPELPLAGLLAERTLYHFDYGVYDRVRAGVAPADAHFARHVPRNLKYVAFVPRLRPKERSEYLILAYFPDYTERVDLEGLEGWNIYARREENPVDRPRPSASAQAGISSAIASKLPADAD